MTITIIKEQAEISFFWPIIVFKTMAVGLWHRYRQGKHEIRNENLQCTLFILVTQRPFILNKKHHFYA